MTSRPDLSVRVGIACAHHLATVLENLHVLDTGCARNRARLVGPDIDYMANVDDWHHREREIVARREADDAADTGLAGGDEQFPLRRPRGARALFEGRKIVVEHERRRVRRISLPVCALIA